VTGPDILFRRLEQAIATMDATSRTVFLAHRLEGLPYDQIAARLSLAISEVEQHLASAILHIDRTLTALEAQEGD